MGIAFVENRRIQPRGLPGNQKSVHKTYSTVIIRVTGCHILRCWSRCRFGNVLVKFKPVDIQEPFKNQTEIFYPLHKADAGRTLIKSGVYAIDFDERNDCLFVAENKEISSYGSPFWIAIYLVTNDTQLSSDPYAYAIVPGEVKSIIDISVNPPLNAYGYDYDTHDQARIEVAILGTDANNQKKIFYSVARFGRSTGSYDTPGHIYHYIEEWMWDLENPTESTPSNTVGVALSGTRDYILNGGAEI